MEATDYASALNMSQSRRRKLANNTYLEVNEDSFGVRLHDTQIIQWYEDGRIVLNTDGWTTVTTKERMNRALRPKWNVYSDKGVWYVNDHPYADGITLFPDGTVTGEGEDPKAQLKLRRRVRAFANDYMDAFSDGKVPAPRNTDCWYCLMEMDHWRDPDHLISHMDEKYYVPSLLAKAIKRFPVSQVAHWVVAEKWRTPTEINQRNAMTDNVLSVNTRYTLNGPSQGTRLDSIAKDQLTKALRRFMYEKLGSAS